MTAIEWTPDDGVAATSEGWDLFEASRGLDAPGLEVQRIDEYGDTFFTGDDEVQAHIHGAAASGSPLHLKVLVLLAQDNPDEFSQILDTTPRVSETTIVNKFLELVRRGI